MKRQHEQEGGLVGGAGGGDWKFVLVLRQGMVPSWTRYIMSFDAEHVK